MAFTKLQRFSKNFGIQEFGIAGSLFTSDGNGQTFWSDEFTDDMDESIINANFWTSVASGDGALAALTGKGIRATSINGTAMLNAKKGQIILSELNQVVFETAIIGTTRGGNGLLVDTGADTWSCGFYADANNRIEIYRTADDVDSYGLKTVKNGNTTNSSYFTIEHETAADQLVKIIATRTSVKAFINDALVATNTVNIPSNKAMKPRLRCAGDNTGACNADWDYCYISIR